MDENEKKEPIEEQQAEEKTEEQEPAPQEEPSAPPQEEPPAEEKTDSVTETLLNLSNKLDKLISLMESGQSEEQEQPGEIGLTPNDPNKTAGANEPKPYLDRYKG